MKNCKFKLGEKVLVQGTVSGIFIDDMDEIAYTVHKDLENDLILGDFIEPEVFKNKT